MRRYPADTAYSSAILFIYIFLVSFFVVVGCGFVVALLLFRQKSDLNKLSSFLEKPEPKIWLIMMGNFRLKVVVSFLSFLRVFCNYKN